MAKLKRKGVDDDFSLSSPATKIRRLDAELPPIIEEDEIMVVGDDKLAVTPPIDEVNHERAIVLYDHMNNIPLLQTRSPFSISVNSDFLSGFKNPAIWSNCSDLLKSLNGETENNVSLAVVPWVAPQHTHNNAAMSTAEVPRTQQVQETMDADDMDIESHINGGIGSVDGVNQCQQHCIFPTSNLSTPIAWSGV